VGTAELHGKKDNKAGLEHSKMAERQALEVPGLPSGLTQLQANDYKTHSVSLIGRHDHEGSPARCQRKRGDQQLGDRPVARSRSNTRALLAFSRTGDPAIGEFQDAVILARFGEVDLDSLGE
jgi:hypothetical protein